MIATSESPVTTIEVPEALLHSVLSPYRTACTYLKRMWIDFHGDPGAAVDAVGGSVVGRGQFAISESFYIDETGHFNAVEFNLCYNQIAYAYLAYCADRALIPAMSDVDLAYYRRQQLGGILIAKFSSSFHSQMAPASFWGELSLSRAEDRKRHWLLDTHIRYWDDRGGRSQGDVVLAFLKETV